MSSAGRSTGMQEVAHEPRGAASASGTSFRPLDVAKPWPSLGDLALAAAVCVAHIAFADSYYTMPTAISCGLEGSVLLLLVTRYMKVHPPRLPWPEVMFAVHYSEFGLPIFGSPTPVGLNFTMPRAESFEFATLLALVSGLALPLGFGVARLVTRRFGGGVLFFPKLDGDRLTQANRVHFILAAAFVVVDGRVPAFRNAIVPAANVIHQFFYYTPLAAVGTLAYLEQPVQVNRLRMFAAFAVLMVVVMSSSMLSDIVVPALVTAALWWYRRKQLPLVALGFATGILFLLQPAKASYRAIHWQNPDAGVIESWQEAFAETSATSNSTFGREEKTLDRVGELSNLAYVVETVPYAVPYAGGMVYPLLFESAIPRLLWPDKPNMTDVGLSSFTLALGLSSPETVEGGSVNGLSLPAEGYYEHGIVGSIGWMMLLGAVLGLVSRYCGTTLAGTLAGACTLGLVCIGVGGGFINVFGGLWQLLAGSTALTWLLWFLGGGHRSGETTARPAGWASSARLTEAPIPSSLNGSGLRGTQLPEP